MVWQESTHPMAPPTDQQTAFLWNKTLPVWEVGRRGTVRVVMVITMDTTALLLIWALMELLFRPERRREGVLFVLKVCYVISVIVTVIFINISLFIHPLNSSCPAVVGVTYVCTVCSLSWGLLTSLQRFLTSRSSSPEMMTSQSLALSLTVGYMLLGYGIPCSGLVTLVTHFDDQQFIAKTMCWLSSEAIWWIVIPVIIFVGGTYTVAMVAFRHHQGTPADVRCFVYMCFVLNCLLASSSLMVHVDLTWPSLNKGYVILLLLITHNVLIWFHLTEAFPEICPCAQSLTDVMAQQIAETLRRPRSLPPRMGPPSRRMSRTQGPRDQSDPGRRQTEGEDQSSTSGGGVCGAASQSATQDDLEKVSLSDDFFDDMGACEDDVIAVEGGSVSGSVCPTQSPAALNLGEEHEENHTRLHRN